VLAHEHAGGAGMIEVDVAEEQVPDVLQGEPEPVQSFLEPRNTGGRAAVEERRPVVGVDEVAADDALDAAVVEVDQFGDPAILARERRRMTRPVVSASASPTAARATSWVGKDPSGEEASGAVAGIPAETSVSLSCRLAWNQPPGVSLPKSL
jgi:hypothetical protein